MTRLIKINENGIYMVFALIGDEKIRLIHLGTAPFNEKAMPENAWENGYLVQYQETGYGSADHRGRKHTGSVPGCWAVYREMRDYKNEKGRKLEIVQDYQGLQLISHYQFYDNVQTIRSWTEVTNQSEQTREIEYVSSFAYQYASVGGNKPWNRKMRLHTAHNSWYDECRWESRTLPEMGLNPINLAQSTKRIYEQNLGSWSTQEFLPMGCLENEETGATFLWQIENNGSWYWEVAESSELMFPTVKDHNLMITNDGNEISGEIYFVLSGPTEWESQWHKSLKPGKSFITVPAAVSVVNGGFEKAVVEMTKYRRKIRRPNKDNEKLAVIFNDYMNCLFGDSTTEKLLPLIDAAADAGCEYFCIDCGWYTDTNWWAGVGEWKPSAQRYPGGIEKPIKYIREKGMIPGLWLEIETVGFDCPNIDKIPKSWFFRRHGKIVSDQCRYQLDFRNPEVQDYATSVIDRMVNEYGVGYIKMDYNINSGIGTEVDSDSLGDGLLEHNRAYLAWLDSIFVKYPDLIIENCGSGGMRMDYAMLSRHSIQSSSDQTDYIKNAAIAASCATALTPEQCAIWSYPLSGADPEETIMNMVNAMMLRIHQSGHLATLPANQFNLVKNGIEVYKMIRNDIKEGLPFWLTGIPKFEDPWFTFGLECDNCAYIAVWRISSEKILNVPLKEELQKYQHVEPVYPQNTLDCAYINENHTISFLLEETKTARIFKLY